MPRPIRHALAILAAALLLAMPPARAQEQVERQAERPPSSATFGELLDAVVQRTAQSFWDKDRLAEVGWEKRAEEARPGIVEAPNLDEAARRINALLSELKTSHTALLTPDEVDYYVQGNVFGRPTAVEGIGIFSVRIDGRDFVDMVLEGSAAARAGIKAGDEIVGVDAKPYHPVRSFRGKADKDVTLELRRVPAGPVETVEVPVAHMHLLEGLHAATRASARIIERNGRRVGYVHVWASTSGFAETLSAALVQIGFQTCAARSAAS